MNMGKSSKFSKYGSKIFIFIKNMNDKKSTFIKIFISVIELTDHLGLLIPNNFTSI